MLPDLEQIRMAAYFRWLNRGCNHGDDRGDWFAATHDRLFALNYEPIAIGPPRGGDYGGLIRFGPRVCRFCEEATPSVAFSGPNPLVPACLGEPPWMVEDHCDDCRESFDEAQEAAFEAFLRPWRADRRFPESEDGRRAVSMPVGAYQTLTRIALSVLPERELDYVSDALEWVINPDPDCDAGQFVGGGCYIHRRATWADRPWVALARRIDDEMPAPYLLGFVGVDDLSIEFGVPLCIRDEDLDGEVIRTPQVACPDEAIRGVGVFRTDFVPVTVQPPRPSRMPGLAASLAAVAASAEDDDLDDEPRGSRRRPVEPEPVRATRHVEASRHIDMLLTSC